MHERENVANDFFSLAVGPSCKVCSYNGCIANGVQFYMVKRDSQCTTQNSGVMVVDENIGNRSTDNNFYGILDEVLDYQIR